MKSVTEVSLESLSNYLLYKEINANFYGGTQSTILLDYNIFYTQLIRLLFMLIFMATAVNTTFLCMDATPLNVTITSFYKSEWCLGYSHR